MITPPCTRPPAIVVLVLGDQRELERAVLQSFPQRADQRQEAGGFRDLPAVGFEFVRGLGWSCDGVRLVE